MSGTTPFISLARRLIRRAKRPEAEVNVVTADYFRVMRMPLLRGRAFTADDRANQPRSVIIDESLAQKYFPAKTRSASRSMIINLTKRIRRR